MGMGEDNGIDVRGTDLERYAVTVAKVFIALEQAALYKDPVALRPDQVSGTCHCVGCAEKPQRRGMLFSHSRSFGHLTQLRGFLVSAVGILGSGWPTTPQSSAVILRGTTVVPVWLWGAARLPAGDGELLRLRGQALLGQRGTDFQDPVDVGGLDVFFLNPFRERDVPAE